MFKIGELELSAEAYEQSRRIHTEIGHRKDIIAQSTCVLFFNIWVK